MMGGMSLATVTSCIVQGSRLIPIQVEAHLGSGLPALQVVGLTGGVLRDARERVRAAIQSSGFKFPARRMVVSLTPSDLPKDSAHLDLPIALALLAASGQIPQRGLLGHAWLGSLSLSGRCLPLPDVLAIGLLARLGALEEVARLALPSVHAEALALLPMLPGRSLGLVAVESLVDAAQTLRLGVSLPEMVSAPQPPPLVGSAEGCVPGLLSLAGALAAAGKHRLLLVGPDSTLRPLVQQSLGLLPALNAEDFLRVNQAEQSHQPGAALIQHPRGLDLASWSPRGSLKGRVDEWVEPLLRGGGVLTVEGLSALRPSMVETLLGWYQRSVAPGAMWMRHPACGCGGAPSSACVCSRQQRRQHWSRLPAVLRDSLEFTCLAGANEALPAWGRLPRVEEWPQHLERLSQPDQLKRRATLAQGDDARLLLTSWQPKRGLSAERLSALDRIARTLAVFRNPLAEAISREDLMLARGMQTGWPLMDELADASSTPGWWSSSGPRSPSRPAAPPPVSSQQPLEGS